MGQQSLACFAIVAFLLFLAQQLFPLVGFPSPPPQAEATCCIRQHANPYYAHNRNRRRVPWTFKTAAGFCSPTLRYDESRYGPWLTPHTCSSSFGPAGSNQQTVSDLRSRCTLLTAVRVADQPTLCQYYIRIHAIMGSPARRFAANPLDKYCLYETVPVPMPIPLKYT